jgi:hypothetical protein
VVLAWLTVAATIVVLVAALFSSRASGRTRLAVDRTILVQAPLAAITALAGLLVALTGLGPADALHFVYAAVVVSGLPVARYAVHRQGQPRFGLWIAVAALVVLGALLRSFMTGH